MSNTTNGGSDSDPPPYNHRTTTAILRHATTTSLSLLPTTLFLTLLLFSFRSFIESGSVFITAFIDSDPSLKSLLSRLDISATTATSDTTNTKPLHHQKHRHRPFLHLTRVGTLDDDDLFSSNENNGPHHAVTNSTLISLSYVSIGVVRPGVGFGFTDAPLEFNGDTIEINNVTSDFPDGVTDDTPELKFVIAGLEIRQREATALLLLISLLSACYGWVILGFVITYSWALGVVFVAVVNDLLDTYSSFSRNVWNGSSLGVRRLSGFIMMRWAVRDAVTQILGLWFFGEIRDQYSFFKLFLRLKLMPFSIGTPWVPGYDEEISGFLFAWFLIDTVVSFVLAVASWVTIVNVRRGGREIVKEGCYLVATMIHQSIQLKCLELILCGAFMKWVLTRACGRSLATLLQSLVEVYFMVAWLIFYFAARCKDASLSGRRFGRTELKCLIEGLR